MSHDAHADTASIDAARAAAYGLIARLFRAPPDAVLLARLAAGASDSDTPGSEGRQLAFHRAWHRLAAAASVVDSAAAGDEFGDLFTGSGRPQVDPYSPRHISGALMSRPLAKLREDLQRLSVARRPGVPETEDHLSSLCEVMRLLIRGNADRPAAELAAQRQFFERHLQPWYARFADSVERAPSANFYKLASRFTRAFLDLEAQGFELTDTGRPREPAHEEGMQT